MSGQQQSQSLDEILRAPPVPQEPEVPEVLRCPGCCEQMVACDGHGHCPEHGCWQDGLSKEPVLCQGPS